MTQRKIKTGALLVFMLLICLTSNLSATEEFAEETGQDCKTCHLDPAGGGELTAAGGGYALSLGQEAGSVAGPLERTRGSRVLRLFVGYLHILFGFFWFGTILYVHLILKPAYASRGLPRGEVKLGLLSMLIMGVTGSILFAYRVPDVAMLFGSRFGILLLIKIGLYLVMVCSALFAVLYLGPRLRRRQAEEASPQSGDLTLAQLARFDGKDGRKAYFAFRGEIFDATDSRLWKNGSHMGRHQAGCDLTAVLDQAPHGEDKVQALHRIGSLVEEAAPGLTATQRLFYTMAYMNLSFVLLIILILACWRWW